MARSRQSVPDLGGPPPLVRDHLACDQPGRFDDQHARNPPSAGKVAHRTEVHQVPAALRTGLVQAVAAPAAYFARAHVDAKMGVQILPQLIGELGGPGRL